MAAMLVAAVGAGCADGGDGDEPGDGSGSANNAQVHKLLSSDTTGNQMTVVFAGADGSIRPGTEVSPGMWAFDARGGGELQVVQRTRQNPAAGLITNEYRVDAVAPGELIEMEGSNPLPAGCSCVQGTAPTVPDGVDLRVVTERYFNPTPRSEDNFLHVFVDDGTGDVPQTPGYDTRTVLLASCPSLSYAELRAKAVTYECVTTTAK